MTRRAGVVCRPVGWETLSASAHSSLFKREIVEAWKADGEEVHGMVRAPEFEQISRA